MMHDREKSDPAIVAGKPTNKAGQPAAELVEPRAGPRGTRAGKSHTGHRTGNVCHRRWTACGGSKNTAICRYTPEVGAVCPNWARTELCGEREVTRVPTANGSP